MSLVVDDRVQIGASYIESFPYNKIGQLRFRDASGVWHTCTGTLVGPRDVLTSGHCLHSGGSSGDWYDKFYFFLKRYSSSEYDTVYEGSQAWSVYGWTTLGNWYYDYGILKLNVDNTNKGWLYFDHWENADIYNTPITSYWFYSYGYPDDKSYGTLWKTQCVFDEAYDQYLVDYYDCILSQNNGGSPMYFSAQLTVYGIYSRSGSKWIGSCIGNICSGYTIDVNYHVRINQGKYDLICDMIDYSYIC